MLASEDENKSGSESSDDYLNAENSSGEKGRPHSEWYS